MNQVIEVIKKVANMESEFTAAELNLSEKDLQEALMGVMQELMEGAPKVGGIPAIQSEDMAYLFLLGLCSGYELHKVQNETNQGEKSADATD